MALTPQEKIDLARQYGVGDDTIQEYYGGNGATPDVSMGEETGEDPQTGLLDSLFHTFLPKTAAVADKLRSGQNPGFSPIAGMGALDLLNLGGQTPQAAGVELGMAKNLPKFGKVGLAPKKFVGQQIERAAGKAGEVPAELLAKLMERFGARFSGLPDPTMYKGLPAVQIPQAIDILRKEGQELIPRVMGQIDPKATFSHLLSRRIGAGQAGYKTTETGAKVAGAMRPVYQKVQGAISDVLKEGAPQLKTLDPIYSFLQKAGKTGEKAKNVIKYGALGTLGYGLARSLLGGIKGQ